MWPDRMVRAEDPRTCWPASTKAWAYGARLCRDIFTRTASTPHAAEETMGALATAAAGQGPLRGISSHLPARRPAGAAAGWKVPLLIHQPSYSMFNRWAEGGLLDVLGKEGVGCIGFSPLAQGLLTDKYLKGIPADARINRPGGDSLQKEHLSDENLARVRALNEIAKSRGQSLAQMALAWVLRDPRVTTTLLRCELSPNS